LFDHLVESEDELAYQENKNVVDGVFLCSISVCKSHCELKDRDEKSGYLLELEVAKLFLTHKLHILKRYSTIACCI